MERKSFADMHCSVAQCLEIVGEWWSMLIVRDAFLGITRFDQFQERLGISRNILNQRLGRLVAEDIMVKVPYSDRPTRYDYRLTDKGRDLWPVITAMRQWGDDHAAPDGPPITAIHKGCAKPFRAVYVCSECGEPVAPRDVRAERGPGYRDDLITRAGDVASPTSTP